MFPFNCTSQLILVSFLCLFRLLYFRILNFVSYLILSSHFIIIIYRVFNQCNLTYFIFILFLHFVRAQTWPNLRPKTSPTLGPQVGSPFWAGGFCFKAHARAWLVESRGSPSMAFCFSELFSASHACRALMRQREITYKTQQTWPSTFAFLPRRMLVCRMVLCMPSPSLTVQLQHVTLTVQLTALCTSYHLYSCNLHNLRLFRHASYCQLYWSTSQLAFLSPLEPRPSWCSPCTPQTSMPAAFSAPNMHSRH